MDRASTCFAPIFLNGVSDVAPLTITNNSLLTYSRAVWLRAAMGTTIPRATIRGNTATHAYAGCHEGAAIEFDPGTVVAAGSVAGNTMISFPMGLTETSTSPAVLACGNRATSSATYDAPAVCPIRAADSGIDVNGDGSADICGRSGIGIDCSLADNIDDDHYNVAAGFSDMSSWSSSFDDSSGANDPQYYTSLGFPDLDGDGRSDLCMRVGAGLSCSLSDGATFATPSLWSADFADTSGWGASASYSSTLRFPDLDGDGKADVCGRSSTGIECALSSGSSFSSLTSWSTSFSDALGWDAVARYSSIAYPDVNGDGKADVCGRASGGIVCALSTGSTFGTPSSWTTSGTCAPAFGDDSGWGVGPEYFSTIRFPDLNGDGKADLCGRRADGIECALSNGSSFASATMWSTELSDALGWNAADRYSTIAYPDVNADGKADLCARTTTGIVCAISSGSSFGALTAWTIGGAYDPAFGDDSGWASGPEYYSTIAFADRDGDGKVDVCGRRAEGVECALNSGSGLFFSSEMWSSDYSDAHNWGSSAAYYSTIH